MLELFKVLLRESWRWLLMSLMTPKSSVRYYLAKSIEDSNTKVDDVLWLMVNGALDDVKVSRQKAQAMLYIPTATIKEEDENKKEVAEDGNGPVKNDNEA